MINLSLISISIGILLNWDPFSIIAKLTFRGIKDEVEYHCTIVRIVTLKVILGE